MSDINRFGPYGLNDLEYAGWGIYLPTLDPSKRVRYFNDFHNYTAGDWTVTETQGSATQAITDAHGGVLALVNSGTENDVNAIQLSKETFKYASGRKLWIKSRFKISDATQSDLIVGLAITDNTIPASLPSDGIFFYKADGSTTLTFHVRKDSSSSSVNVGTMANDTYVVVALYFDGNSTWTVLLNDAVVSTVTSSTNAPDDEELAISLAVAAGDGNARTLSVDYIDLLSDR